MLTPDREQAIQTVMLAIAETRFLSDPVKKAERIVDALLGQSDPEVERLRAQVCELLSDVELLEKNQDPPSVTRTARKLRSYWIDDAFTQRRRAVLAEERLHELERVIHTVLQSDLALTDEPREALACRDSVMNALRTFLPDQEDDNAAA